MLYDETKYKAPVTEPVTWRNLLLRAADYIESHGWAQNSVCTETGAVCLRGAILAAQGMHMKQSHVWWGDASIVAQHASHAVAQYLTRTGRVNSTARGDEEVLWNNARERTGEDVLNAMRAAAKDARP